MAKPIIALPKLSDAATLTASSETADYESTFLQTMALSEKWRTTGVASEYLEIDLGAAHAVNVFALLGTNLTSAATWQVRAASSQADLTTSPGYDSGAVTAWAQTGLDDWDETPSILYLSTAETYQWWRVDLIDAANSDGYLEVGRLYVSAEPALTVGFAFGSGQTWTNPSRVLRTPGGQAWILEREGWRVFDGVLPYLSEAEARATLANLQRLRGHRKDVLLLADPESTYLCEETIYGVVSEMRAIIKRAPAIFQTRFRVVELR